MTLATATCLRKSPDALPRADGADEREGQSLGPYRLDRLLGVGGMGFVYQAMPPDHASPMALKLLRPELARDPAAVRRFYAEARALAELRHPNIVSVLDIPAEHDASEPYFVMELLQGESLAAVRRRDQMPLERALTIARQVCEALLHVHRAGIVHRDLKPENIFLCRDARGGERVKLLDFGVAKLAGAAQYLDVTTTGIIVGTPDYMSPEQASGAPIDHRTDIYAFGVVLYQLITGQKPFVAKTFAELLIKHLSQRPVPPTLACEHGVFIPEELDDLVLQCLAKPPDERPQDATALLACLDDVSLRPRPRRRLRSRRLRITAAAGAAIALAGTLVLSAAPAVRVRPTHRTAPTTYAQSAVAPTSSSTPSSTPTPQEAPLVRPRNDKNISSGRPRLAQLRIAPLPPNPQANRLLRRALIDPFRDGALEEDLR